MPFSAATIRISSANSGWLWRYSRGMRQLRRVEKLIEELACAHTAVVAHRPAQARAVESGRAFFHAIEHFAFRFRQRIEIVHEIDQQKFLAKRLREVRL